MIIAEVEDGKLRRLYADFGDGNEVDFPIDEKTKLAMDAHGSYAAIRVKVERVIDITD